MESQYRAGGRFARTIVLVRIALVIVIVIALAPLGCVESRTLTPDPDPPGTIDVAGRWHDCASTLTFAEGGAATLADHRRGCTASGTFDVDGNVLEVTWPDAACAREDHWLREVVRPDGALVLVDPLTAGIARYGDDATPRSRWLFESADPPRSSTVRIIGTPGVGVGQGCYWSTDGGCGGFFSCSGTVLGWTEDTTTVHATTGCSGECPCGAVLDGTALSDGSFAATYRGASCEMPLEGAFTMTRLED
jgi:hypothetical protein